MFHILYHPRPPVFIPLFSILSLFCDLQSMNSSPPDSSVHGILQARILKWAAIPFSRRSFWPRDWILVPCIAGRFFTIWVTRKAHPFSQLIFFHKPKKQEQLQKNFQKLPSPCLTPVQMFFLPVNLDDISLILCVKNRFLLCNILCIFSTSQGLMAWVNLCLPLFIGPEFETLNYSTRYRHFNVLKSSFIPLFYSPYPLYQWYLSVYKSKYKQNTRAHQCLFLWTAIISFLEQCNSFLVSLSVPLPSEIYFQQSQW